MSFLSPIHIAFIAAIVLLVVGPKRFPEFTRALGKGMREFREVLKGVPGRDDLARDATAADVAAEAAADATVPAATVAASAIAPAPAAADAPVPVGEAPLAAP